MPNILVPICCLMLLLTAQTATANATEEYMRAMALVNWTEVIPETRFTEEDMPKSFNARVRKSGKLKSLGLPVTTGDMVRMDQLGPYIWKVSKDLDSIKINTYDIPATAYPRFQ